MFYSYIYTMIIIFFAPQIPDNIGKRCHTGQSVCVICLCSVLGPSLQEGHWGAESRPEKDNGDSQGSGTQVLWEMAEGAEGVYPE